MARRQEVTEILDRFERFYTQLTQMEKVQKQAPEKVKQAWEAYHHRCTLDYLKTSPVENLAVIQKGLPLSALEAAGLHDVATVYGKRQWELETIPGIGSKSANRILQAAKTVYRVSKEEVKPRLHPDSPSSEEVEIFRTLVHYQTIDHDLVHYKDLLKEQRESFEIYFPVIQEKGGFFKQLFTSRTKKLEIQTAEEQLEEALSGEQAQQLNHLYQQAIQNTDSVEALREEFIEKNIEFYTILEKLTGFGTVTEQTDLATDLVKSIEAYPLNLAGMTLSLRGYQEFGAKYILHQKRVLLGDEMGLGKTIQALVAIHHLYQHQQHYSVVICPLSVVTNWQREIKKFTTIPTFIFHGRTRDEAWDAWTKEGGVLITTYEQSKHIELKTEIQIDICVVDEAHYVKNPQAQRSQAVYAVLEQAEYMVFMSGTPLENRLDEMKQLISVLQPTIADQIDLGTHVLRPQQFRQLVAPVYLRRNRQEVLAELPDLEVFERWVDFGEDEFEVYRDYVEMGNLMGMRRAAWAGGTPALSPKLDMLLEILDEARDSGYKVLIFSFFKDVIRTIHRTIEPYTFEPISGDISNERRQEIIDEFSAAKPGSVLISQITAGGVGLNIQAANVVILCEPQWKPSIEQQAVSRAYRMGQARDVLVYRILTNDSIDESMLDLLGYKTQIFDDYARESDIADQSDLAKDVSDKEMRMQLISKEKERLRVSVTQTE